MSLAVQLGGPRQTVNGAWDVLIETLLHERSDLAGRVRAAIQAKLEFVQSALAWCDAAMVTTAAAHQKAELAFALSEEQHRIGFVRGVLFGSLPPSELRFQAEAYGLDPGREYVAVRARLGRSVTQDKLERAFGRGLTAIVDGCVGGFLSDPPPRDIDALVGVGPPRLLEQLSQSYRSAARALATMEACGLRGGYDIRALGLRAAVAMDAEVGQALLERYVEPLHAGGSACELIATLRVYLACGMHVERTATRLFVHQNTVRYRLARFEQLTGASLRETQVLFELWWALELSAMRL